MKIAEAQAELENTRKDYERLGAIVDNMRLFIRESGGEDRRYLKTDLLKYESLLVEAERLIRQIERAIKSLKH